MSNPVSDKEKNILEISGITYEKKLEEDGDVNVSIYVNKEVTDPNKVLNGLDPNEPVKKEYIVAALATKAEVKDLNDYVKKNELDSYTISFDGSKLAEYPKRKEVEALLATKLDRSEYTDITVALDKKANLSELLKYVPKTQFEAQMSNIDFNLEQKVNKSDLDRIRQTLLNTITDTFATYSVDTFVRREELANYPDRREVANALLKKANMTDIEGLASKAEISELATKQEISKLVTVEDFERKLATKLNGDLLNRYKEEIKLELERKANVNLLDKYLPEAKFNVEILKYYNKEQIDNIIANLPAPAGVATLADVDKLELKIDKKLEKKVDKTYLENTFTNTNKLLQYLSTKANAIELRSLTKLKDFEDFKSLVTAKLDNTPTKKELSDVQIGLTKKANIASLANYVTKTDITAYEKTASVDAKLAAKMDANKLDILATRVEVNNILDTITRALANNGANPLYVSADKYTIRDAEINRAIEDLTNNVSLVNAKLLSSYITKADANELYVNKDSLKDKLLDKVDTTTYESEILEIKNKLDMKAERVALEEYAKIEKTEALDEEIDVINAKLLLKANKEDIQDVVKAIDLDQYATKADLAKVDEKASKVDEATLATLATKDEVDELRRSTGLGLSNTVTKDEIKKYVNVDDFTLAMATKLNTADLGNVATMDNITAITDMIRDITNNPSTQILEYTPAHAFVKREVEVDKKIELLKQMIKDNNNISKVYLTLSDLAPYVTNNDLKDILSTKVDTATLANYVTKEEIRNLDVLTGVVKLQEFNEYKDEVVLKLLDKANKTDLDLYVLKTDMGSFLRASDLVNYVTKEELANSTAIDTATAKLKTELMANIALKVDTTTFDSFTANVYDKDYIEEALSKKVNISQLADYATKEDVLNKELSDATMDILNTKADKAKLDEYVRIDNVSNYLNMDNVNAALEETKNNLKRELDTTLLTKVSVSDFRDALNTKLDVNTFNTEIANYTSTNDLNSLLDTKADKTALEQAKTDISSKASQTEVTALSNKINALEAASGNNAAALAMETRIVEIDNKVDKGIKNLENTVNTNIQELNNQILSKVSSEDLVEELSEYTTETLTPKITEAKTAVKDEIQPLLDGKENKGVAKQLVDALKQTVDTKLNISVYNSEKGTFALKTELGNYVPTTMLDKAASANKVVQRDDDSNIAVNTIKTTVANSDSTAGASHAVAFRVDNANNNDLKFMSITKLRTLLNIPNVPTINTSTSAVPDTIVSRDSSGGTKVTSFTADNIIVKSLPTGTPNNDSKIIFQEGGLSDDRNIKSMTIPQLKSALGVQNTNGNYYNKDTYNAIPLKQVSGNTIDFNQGDNFNLAFSSGTLTFTNLHPGQAGVIYITNANAITGYGTNAKWRDVPATLEATEAFGYWIDPDNKVRLGRI